MPPAGRRGRRGPRVPLGARATVVTLATLAAFAAGGGLVALVAAVGSTSALYGYVSEAGARGAPLAGVYRAGILAVAAALALLAGALRPVARAAALALGAAAAFAVVSGVVTCSPGCPLPPYERPTAADLVHGAASIAGLALSALAMLLLARAPRAARQLRLVCAIGAAVAIPLLAAAGLALLFAGRGYPSGVLERAALMTALGWLGSAAVAVRSAQRVPDDDGGDGGDEQ